MGIVESGWHQQRCRDRKAARRRVYRTALAAAGCACYRSNMNTQAQAPTETSLHHTPFYDFHVAHGGHMVPFAGWEMPIRYGSIIAEHHQVRRSGGLFDVSHMGRLRFVGKDARRFLDRVHTRNIAKMKDGMARYGLVCNDHGGVHDDALVYRISDTEYMMVCNAANRDKLLEHFEHVRGDLVFKLQDETESTAMIALQGPKIMDLLSQFSSEVPQLKKFRFTIKNVVFAKMMISRTGYTGENGVEVILPAKFARKAVDMLLKNIDLDADDAPVKPIGLGARDTLRLEAAMPLYGHELTEDLDPVSAGLTFAIELDKGDDEHGAEPFIGQAALRRIADAGPTRKLVGLVLQGKRSARQDMTVLRDGGQVGFVTSGCSSPTIGKPIAMAYVDAAHSEPGMHVQVDLGRSQADAEVVSLPFYKPPK